MVSKNNSADAEAAAATAADDENAPMEIKYLQLSKQLAHTGMIVVY
jgi:hypothetical protein